MRSTIEGRAVMEIEYLIGAILAVLLGAYLVYALLFPERF
jgi:K+-transporting ATPase KdpF subunit